jgi:hypothetical protein
MDLDPIFVDIQDGSNWNKIMVSACNRQSRMEVRSSEPEQKA